MRVHRTFLARVTQVWEVEDGPALDHDRIGRFVDDRAADEYLCGAGVVTGEDAAPLDDWQLDLVVALDELDTCSSASRQHFIETGRYLRASEVLPDTSA